MLNLARTAYITHLTSEVLQSIQGPTNRQYSYTFTSVSNPGFTSLNYRIHGRQMASQDSKEVTARYASPSGTKDFNLPLASACPTKPTVEEKTAYLSELRTNTKQSQENINAFLTEKMAEDKACEGQASATTSKSKSEKRDEVAEENYGEEVVEDEG